MKKKLFLSWWFIVTLTGVGAIISWHLGLLHDIWENDSSYLSAVIAAVFVYMSGWCGIKSWKVSVLLDGHEDQKIQDKITKQEEIGWFTSEVCLSLGMIGTIWGFILMSKSFNGIDASNVEQLKTLIATMFSGMSTALYTTFVGLICSVLLKIQYFQLSQSVRELPSLSNLQKNKEDKKECEPACENKTVCDQTEKTVCEPACEKGGSNNE